MKRTIKSWLTFVLVFTTLVAADWRSSKAAEEAHQHRNAPPPSAPAQPSPEQRKDGQPNAMPRSAEDMMRAMETMPAHSHDACCGVKKPDLATGGHNH